MFSYPVFSLLAEVSSASRSESVNSSSESTLSSDPSESFSFLLFLSFLLALWTAARILRLAPPLPLCFSPESGSSVSLIIID